MALIFSVTSVTIPSITPVMVIGENNGKIFYGMNDSYLIQISDLSGKNTGAFSLESKVNKVSKVAVLL